MKRKMTCLLLALVLVVGCLPLSASAAGWSSNWKLWSQQQSDYEAVRLYGCRIVATAKLLQEAGIADASFNPDRYLEWGVNNGVFPSTNNVAENNYNGAGGYAGSVGKTLYYWGEVDLWGNSTQRAEQVMQKINEGFFVLVGSDAHYAYISRYDSLNNGYPVLWDSWSPEFSGPSQSYDFRYYGPEYKSWQTAKDRMRLFKLPDNVNPTPSPTPSNITLDTPWVDNISNTGATIHSVIRNNRQRVRAYGLEVWEKNTKKNVIDHWEDIPSNYQTLNHIDIWVNTIEELGVSLKPGTEYGCFFFIDEGGKVFSGETYFKTTGASVPSETSAPSISRLSISSKEVLMGENITFTCTSDTATGYTLVVNRGSTRVLTKEIPSGSFATSFDEPGEYSAYVSAYNNSGKLDSSRVYFTVNEDEDDDTLDPTPENDFIDVPNGAYFAKAVNWAVENNITAGTGKTTFSPNAVCTRAQAVTFLWRYAGSPKPAVSSSKFTDVAPGQYYTDAVLWAVEKGITGGVSATRFAPDDKCTRAQIVSFLHRMNGSPSVSGVSPFLDVPPSLYYANSVAWAVEKGITMGTSASYFSPHNDCSRGQIVTFLYRYAG